MGFSDTKVRSEPCRIDKMFAHSDRNPHYSIIGYVCPVHGLQLTCRGCWSLLRSWASGRLRKAQKTPQIRPRPDTNGDLQKWISRGRSLNFKEWHRLTAEQKLIEGSYILTGTLIHRYLDFESGISLVHIIETLKKVTDCLVQNFALFVRFSREVFVTFFEFSVFSLCT